MSSDRSFKVSGDDIDSASLSSYHKRNRMPHRNISLDSSHLCKIDDTPSYYCEGSNDDLTEINVSKQQSSIAQDKSSLNVNMPASATVSSDQLDLNNSSAGPSSQDAETTKFPPKNMSKAAVLRQLFFSQINPNSNNDETAKKLLKSKTSTAESLKLIDPTSTNLNGPNKSFESSDTVNTIDSNDSHERQQPK